MARKRNRFAAMLSGAFSPPRYTTRIPDPVRQPDSSPWYFTAGPVFTPGGDGAILNSKYSKPPQVVQGYAYLVGDPQRYSPIQPAQLYAPKSVSTVGINIQLGNQGVLTPSVNSDGTFADEGIFAYDMNENSDYAASEGAQY